MIKYLRDDYDNPYATLVLENGTIASAIVDREDQFSKQVGRVKAGGRVKSGMHLPKKYNGPYYNQRFVFDNRFGFISIFDAVHEMAAEMLMEHYELQERPLEEYVAFVEDSLR